jgi:hypothetical protein
MTFNQHDDNIPSDTDEQTAQAQRRRADRLHDRVTDFERALFNARARYLVLVLTLNYKPEYRHEITLDDVRRHRDALLNNARSNAVLCGIQESTWKIEYGDHAGGLHMHFIAFYDGSHRADIYFADYIGKYWADGVTHGRGAYWSSNANKAKCESGPYGNVTGRIDRGDAFKRQALRDYLENYLAKDDQHVSLLDSPHSHTFGMSRPTRR